MQLESIAQAEAYDHIFISPHHDDLALSCGGTALTMRDRGERVLTVAVFVGRPPSDAEVTEFAAFQHKAWGSPEDPWEARRTEERAVMAGLGIDYLWLDYLDAIYRGSQYLSDDDLFGVVKPDDQPVQSALAMDLLAICRRSPGARLYVPLAVGQHVDHQLCYAAADVPLAAGASVAYYEDVPYALQPDVVEARIASLGRELRPEIVEIGSLIDAKIQLVEAYRSQTEWIFRHHGPASEVLRRHAAGLSRTDGEYAERLWVPVAGSRGTTKDTKDTKQDHGVNG